MCSSSTRWRQHSRAVRARIVGPEFKSHSDRKLDLFCFWQFRVQISAILVNSQLVCLRPVGILKGTGSWFSACSFIKMLFFCRNMLYRLCKQYDHVLMLSKNQSAYSPGSHLHLIDLNIFK